MVTKKRLFWALKSIKVFYSRLGSRRNFPDAFPRGCGYILYLERCRKVLGALLWMPFIPISCRMDFRPIILTSFALKTLHRLIHRGMNGSGHWHSSMYLGCLWFWQHFNLRRFTVVALPCIARKVDCVLKRPIKSVYICTLAQTCAVCPYGIAILTESIYEASICEVITRALKVVDN